jgi:hypothetical protein
MKMKKYSEPMIGLYEMGKANKAKKRAEKVSMIVDAKLMADQIEKMLYTNGK